MTTASARRILARVGGFGLAPLLSMVAPLLLLPVVARIAGVEGWAAIAIGQSAGALAATVVGYGWGLTGPVEVARTDRTAHQRMWSSFLCASALLLVAVNIVACALLITIAPDGHKLLACAVAVGGSLLGVCPDWYAIGLGRPTIIVLFNTGPRLISLAVGLPLLLVSESLWWYPVALITGPTVGLALFSMRELPPSRPEAGILSTGVSELRRHAHAALASVTGSAYSTGAVLIVGIFAAPTATAHIASTDKLFRFATQSIGTLGRALQSWVVTPDHQTATRRRWMSLRIHVVLGTLGLLFFASLASVTTGILFGPDVRSNAFTGTMYGIAFASLAINSSLGRHVLLPNGQVSAVLKSTTAGALVGLPGIAVGAQFFGADGASAGFACSEIVVSAVQVALIVRARRRPSNEMAGDPFAN